MREAKGIELGMRDQFSSKLYLESEKNNIGFRIAAAILAVIVTFCVLIKIIAGDFSLADVPWLLIIVVMMQWIRSKTEVKYVYAHGQCVIDYDKDKMTITYPNMNAGKRGTFKDVNVIRYDDIENIQFGKELGCFRIVAKGNRTREYSGKGKAVQMATADKISETYIYVLEEEEQEQIMRNLQRKAGFIVNVLEKND